MKLTTNARFRFFPTHQEQIFLTDNTIYGPIPSQMASLTRLERLQIPRNSISGRIPTEIGLLERLEVLSLGRNILSNGIPSEIGLLTNLEYLNVHHNDLQGQIPTEIGNLSNLNFLSAEGNILTGSLPEELSNLNSVTTLALQENGLNGAVPEGVCSSANTRGNVAVSVDCDRVRCSCCTPMCNQTVNIPPTTPPTRSPTNAPTAAFPNIDSTSAVVVQQGQLNNNSYVIDVGSDCYNPHYVIDFTTELSQPTQYDLIALVPFEAIGASDSIVSTYNFFTSVLYWASSCDLTDCDGVISDGVVYYRNKHPSISSSQPSSWPLGVGFYQLHLVQVDETGTAYVTTRSRQFAVAEDCG
jgi:hypothetical protein